MLIIATDIAQQFVGAIELLKIRDRSHAPQPTTDPKLRDLDYRESFFVIA